MGYFAGGASTTVSNNVIIGTQAGEDLTTGGNTVLLGHLAGADITTGTSNTVIGKVSGRSITTGAGNICLGVECASVGTVLTTGTDNIFIGNGINAGSATGTQRLAIGHSVAPAGDNMFTFGKGTGNDRVYNQFTVNASWTRVSDERYKTEITDNTDCGLAFINDLRPVTFKWKAKSEIDSSLPDYNASKTTAEHTEKMYGLIAQEVKTAMATHNITDFGGHDELEESGIQGISQEMFVHPLIKAVQELSAQVIALTARITTLEGE